MDLVHWILLIVSVLLVVALGFLRLAGMEFVKKFGFNEAFLKQSHWLKRQRYYNGIEEGKKPGMYKVMIESDEHFSVMIGFKLNVPFFGSGVDYYGCLKSTYWRGKHRIMYETWLGKGSCEFLYLFNSNLAARTAYITISKESFIGLEPMVIYQPHWWQRLGFFG